MTEIQKDGWENIRPIEPLARLKQLVSFVFDQMHHEQELTGGGPMLDRHLDNIQGEWPLEV